MSLAVQIVDAFHVLELGVVGLAEHADAGIRIDDEIDHLLARIVTESGAIDMSTCPFWTTGTFVSWLTGTSSSLTPSCLTYSWTSSQTGPSYCSPCPVVFSCSHG